ncbi:MAG: hypothetical protein ACE5GT_13220 [Rhodospirillales bacterium]
MDVLGPVPAFEPNPVPLDWITEGTVGDGQLAVVERAGVPALRVVNGPRSFVTAKPTAASLLATPYLSWAWNMEPQEKGTHPVRLVVGFHGGNPESRRWGSPPAGRSATALPPHDRAVVIIWSESALQRGTITKPMSTKPQQAASRYAARGGRENTGAWWLETVDLSDIYRRTWPGDDPARARISFIGVAAAAGKAPSPAYISGIRLSR